MALSKFLNFAQKGVTLVLFSITCVGKFYYTKNYFLNRLYIFYFSSGAYTVSDGIYKLRQHRLKYEKALEENKDS